MFRHMSLKLVFLVAYVLLSLLATSLDDIEFTFNGFRSANLILDGLARVTSNGLLQLNNFSSPPFRCSSAIYPNPIKFRNSPNAPTFSFFTSFVFAIVPRYPCVGGVGLALFMSPTNRLHQDAGRPSYLGIFNPTNNGDDNNHIFAVELDTLMNNIFRDIDANHVGIDINGVTSATSHSAGYYNHKDGEFNNLTLISGQPIQLWVEYSAADKQINVTLSPQNVDKPKTPLLSLSYDLSSVLKETMYMGFSSCTASGPASHYILGWTFKVNGKAQGLDLSKLPKLPRVGPHKVSDFLKFGVPTICILMMLIVAAAVCYYVARKRRLAEVLEEWELAYGTQRFKYKDLYAATEGFKEKRLLGSGGFGRVYKGILPTTKTEIAVKKVSHDSRQGIKEFIAEIVSMGHLCHRNLVPLLGYSRRKGELLLVYEYMSNGSLDKFLHEQQHPFVLNWNQRFKIIKGVASGLLYLHEEWEQRVIHRDIKASNVLLDGELNGRLGDFGLAKLYDHGSAPESTRIVGTLGYLAPELNITGKATTSTDVYAFGAFLLEVACGRRPIEPRASSSEEMILIHWVFSSWRRGDIFGAMDPNLGSDFVKEEAELVLKLGLLCCHSEAMVRPSMRQVIMYFEGSLAMPELSSFDISAVGLAFSHPVDFEAFSSSFMFTTKTDSLPSSFITESVVYSE